MSDPVNAATLAYKGFESAPAWVAVVLLALAFACLAVGTRRRDRR